MQYAHEQKERREKRHRAGARMPSVDHTLWGMMETYLSSRGLDYPTAKFNGWYPSSCAGDNYERVVMPAKNSKGLAYWQARAMVKGSEPRYQSPSVPRGDSIITLWPPSKDWMPFFVVTEGPMDALAAASSGLRAAALMGTSPTEETLDILVSLSEDSLVTYFADRDAIEEAINLVQALMKRGIRSTISDPTPYKDLAAIPKRKRDDLFKSYIAHCPK